MSSKWKGACVLPSPPVVTLTDAIQAHSCDPLTASITLKPAPGDGGASDRGWDAAA